MRKVFQIVLWALLATLSVLLITGLILPSHYHVERKILIDAPASRVHPFVDDLTRWPLWASWNRKDPTLKLTYSTPAHGVGASETWQGEKSGSGTTTLTESAPARGVWFKSELGDGTSGTGSVTYAEANGTTTVTWTNDGKLPSLIGGYFRGYFEEVLGSHCEEGLKRLKAAVENSPAAP